MALGSKQNKQDKPAQQPQPQLRLHHPKLQRQDKQEQNIQTFYSLGVYQLVV